MIARAHMRGVTSAFATILVSATIAVGLKLNWLFWGSLCVSPLVFQFTSARMWRGEKPKAMLEYLAARSAGRRYAFSKKAKDLTIDLIFRATLREIRPDNKVEEAIHDIEHSSRPSDMWVVLLTDTFVVMSEAPGGAKLEFGCQLNEQLKLDPMDESDSRSRTLRFSWHDTFRDFTYRFELHSRFPAAMVVFEKRILAAQQTAKRRSEERLKDAADLAALGEGDGAEA